jgi:Uma2 family endonuclease
VATEVGFKLAENPDTVRIPDIAFIAEERTMGGKSPKGYWPITPDLAVEIVSPFDQVGDIEAKIADYLRAGVRLVWVVYPGTQTVVVYRSLTDVRILTAADLLTGAYVIPGFSHPVAEIFA